MGWWRDILRLFGLTNDARVHISAPGVDVVVTGEPEMVRQLLVLVKTELERNPRLREPMRRRDRSQGVRTKSRTPQYVQPTELDEMDSPYALSEALVVPVEETTDEHDKAPKPPISRAAHRPKGESQARPPPLPKAFAGEPATLVPDPFATPQPPLPRPSFHEATTGSDIAVAERPLVDRPSSPDISETRIDSNPNVGDEEGEREVTAISPNPSGGLQVQGPAIVRGASSPFMTDGGPTLTPSSDPDLPVRPRSASDPDDTRETPSR